VPELACRLEPVTAVPGAVVAVVRGVIDSKNVDSLGAEFTSAAAKGFRTVILDLRDIRYINSSGLAFLVNLSDFLSSRGGSLHLASAQPKVKVVFELMAVDRFFSLHASVDAAIAAVSKVRRAPRRVPSRLPAGR
jgi:anti-sigma B factor antagonist